MESNRGGKEIASAKRAAEREVAAGAVTGDGSRKTLKSSEVALSPVQHQVEHVIQYEAPPLPSFCYDPDTTAPVSFYIPSFEQLKLWQPSTQDDQFNRAVIPLAPRQPPLQCNRPRTLVCHDMAGGYLSDRYIQGTCDENPFIFYHWMYIDIFVYFSHHMVTIPPVCWTNAAHKHGVAILGTFITEWIDGAAVCEAFLENEESFCALAEKLVKIALHFQFDGWLINIENKLSSIAVKNMPKFLRHLRTRMQQAVPWGLVIWYDSVLETGVLHWQNELNEHNRVFFDSCDGIFLNYNWTEQHLERVTALVEGRHADVYVGVDVFGRGEVIGGGFKTNRSFELIRKYNFSGAIFAPGWVYETLDKERFHQNQLKFWSLLIEYLHSHRICTLPLVTSFCQGFGKNIYRNGEVETTGNWLNLSTQEIQPLFVDQLPDQVDSLVKTYGCSEDAWNGGCSLVIKGLIPSTRLEVSVRLFGLQVQSPPKLFVAFIYKLQDGSGVSVRPELTTCPLSQCSSDKVSSVNVLKPLPLPEDNAFVQKFIQNYAPWSTEGWTYCCFLLELTECILQDFSVSIAREVKDDKDMQFKCRIGEIKILDAAELSVEHVPVEKLSIVDILWRKVPETEDQLSLSVTLQWTYPPNTASYFKIYCQGISQYQDKKVAKSKMIYVGRTCANSYRVVGLQVHNAPMGKACQVEFLIQPVSRAGFLVNQSAWGKLTLNYNHPH
ncbi:cytosolic endo-beta-N-acetylglucosaminidase isoform X1 [Hypanus sabinus]|uniref:cytosolic endo-beta-N-acetylglucosaminidase isoform X1 n=1 Tax=Hypanus sabinus TaxID=79690 RepID=UPI0028C395A0|nr:cytosolic endo-beta-N-acetylglucosaminidase isoform X1 [Hypanus sabinus]